MDEWTTRLSGTLALAWVDGPDGIAFWVCGERGAPLVFVQHGLGSRKERHLALALQLAQAGLCVVMPDAPLHGERRGDAGKPLKNWHHPDFLATVYRVVRQGGGELATIAAWLGAERFAVVGHSMGGLVALWAGRTLRQVAAVAVVGTPLGPDAMPEGVELTPDMRALLGQYDPIARAADFWPRPMLLLHGGDDPMTPPSGTRALHAALAPHYAADPARLIWAEEPGAGHSLTPDMAQAIVAFVAEALRP